MATAQLGPIAVDATIDPMVSYVCFTRKAWGDEWELNPYLYPEVIRHGVAPSMSSARFIYNFGVISQPGNVPFSVYESKDLKGQFVRVDFITGTSQATAFIGVFTEPEAELYGTRTDPANPGAGAIVPTGNDVLTAAGLEYLLNINGIAGSYVQSGSYNPGEIGRVLTFNGTDRHGPSIFGNRTTTEQANSGDRFAHVFSGTDLEVWSNKDIVEYLLTFEAGQDPMFVLGGQVEALASIQEIHRFKGTTILDALNQLISRKRHGLGFFLDFSGVGDGGDNKVTIHVFSVFGEDIQVDGQLFPANDRQTKVNVAAPIDLETVRTKVSVSGQYDRVIVQGERPVVMFSISKADSTLESNWTASEEAQYKAAEDDTRDEDQYRRVYAAFKLPLDWDWTAKDGENGGTPTALNFKFKDNGERDEANTLAIYEDRNRTLRRFLPLQKPSADMNSAPEFFAPMAFAQRFSSTKFFTEASNEWVQLNNPTTKAAARVRSMDAEHGIEILFRPNHRLAGADFDTTKAGDFSQHMPEYDWRTMILTVATEQDQQLQVTKRIPDASNSGQERRKVIRIKDAHYWYVAPGTVTGGGKAGLVRQFPGGTVLRDDSARLRRVAELAAQWYQKPRTSLTVKARSLDKIPPYILGSYIPTIESGTYKEQVGTVITSITYDCRAEQTTTIETGYVELDFGRDFGAGRLQDRLDKMAEDMDQAMKTMAGNSVERDTKDPPDVRLMKATADASAGEVPGKPAGPTGSTVAEDPEITFNTEP